MSDFWVAVCYSSKFEEGLEELQVGFGHGLFAHVWKLIRLHFDSMEAYSIQRASSQSVDNIWREIWYVRHSLIIIFIIVIQIWEVREKNGPDGNRLRDGNRLGQAETHQKTSTTKHLTERQLYN